MLTYVILIILTEITHITCRLSLIVAESRYLSVDVILRSCATLFRFINHHHHFYYFIKFFLLNITWDNMYDFANRTQL